MWLQASSPPKPLSGSCHFYHDLRRSTKESGAVTIDGGALTAHLSYVSYLLLLTHSTGVGINTRLAGPEHGIASSIITIGIWRSSIWMGKAKLFPCEKAYHGVSSHRNTFVQDLYWIMLRQHLLQLNPSETSPCIIYAFASRLSLETRNDERGNCTKSPKKTAEAYLLLSIWLLCGPLRGPGMGSLLHMF